MSHNETIANDGHNISSLRDPIQPQKKGKSDANLAVTTLKMK
jgi:hypothetical protein